MAFLRSLSIYLFWPNPGNATYLSPKIQAALGLCILLLLFSVSLHFLRRASHNPVFKKLSRSWSSVSFWFGIAGAVFIVSRVESIGFLAMRVWWVAWGIAAAFIIGVQVRLFRARYYEPLPRDHSEDPRDRYLPRKKK